MKKHISPVLSVVALALTLAACGKPKPATEAMPPAESRAAAEAAPAAIPATEPAAEPLPRSSSAEGASVAIVSPRDGEIVSSPVKVVFELKGMTLAPAGDATPNSGHHHLLVDVPVPDLGQPIPKDAQHLHFGQGQTEAEITLAPGSHTLQLVLGDSSHIPHNPPVISAPITITVQ
jgi:predicted small lipoprotein YifL